MIAQLLPMFALWQGAMGVWSFIDWACFIIALAGVAAIVMVALRYFGYNPPPELIRVFWIVVFVVACIAAILFIAHMVNG
jgi:choline-glycine betaine transporter